MSETPAGHGVPKHSSAFDPALQGWEPYSDEGFIGLVGPLWQKTDEQGIRFAFLAERKHHNRRGVVQGGMLMTFADRALGMTAWHANGCRPQATIQLDVHFVDAVRIGEFVEAQCRVMRRTKSVLFLSATLVVGSRVVATANGIWKVLNKA